MPEGVGYGPQNTASVGLELNVIGDFCYAYSGQILIANTTTTCLSFTTGNHVSVVEFTQSIDAEAIGQGQLIGFIIEMNGVVVTELKEILRDVAGEESVGLLYYRFIIPPYTQVTTKGITDDASDNPFFHTISGRIYK